MNYTLQTHTPTCEHVCVHVYVNVYMYVYRKTSRVCRRVTRHLGVVSTAVSHLFNKLPIGQGEYLNSEMFQLNHEKCWHMEIEYNYMYHFESNCTLTM